jgi:hypothetical protein
MQISDVEISQIHTCDFLFRQLIDRWVLEFLFIFLFPQAILVSIIHINLKTKAKTCSDQFWKKKCIKKCVGGDHY